MPRYGFGVRPPPESRQSSIVVEPTLGFDFRQPPTDLPIGSAASGQNYILRDGALEPRPMLTPYSLSYSTSVRPFGTAPIVGGLELVSSLGTRFPIVSVSTRWAAYSLSSAPDRWSELSYVSAGGVSDPPTSLYEAGAVRNREHWDFTAIYDPTPDDTIILGAVNHARRRILCTRSDSTLFSTMTLGAYAKFLTTHDNFALAYNVRDQTGTDLNQPTRVQWSDRGDPQVWSFGSGLAGYTELAARGNGTRIIGLDRVVLAFTEYETWQGYRVDLPFVFHFEPLDRLVGCPYSYTIANTPLGVIFLSRDYRPYLIPSGGGKPIPIGDAIHPRIRDTIQYPENAWAVFSNELNQYQLHYAAAGDATDGFPGRAFYFDVKSGAWAHQQFGSGGSIFALSHGFEVQGSRSSTTWGGLTESGITWGGLKAIPTRTWAELDGSVEPREIIACSSQGSVYRLTSRVTSDHGSTVRSVWRSGAFGGEEMGAHKTLTELRIDYRADSASSISVAISRDAGQSFVTLPGVSLQASSFQTQITTHPYLSAQYPMFEVSSEGARYRLQRFWLSFKGGGR